jgi:hypothetical protein
MAVKQQRRIHIAEGILHDDNTYITHVKINISIVVIRTCLRARLQSSRCRQGEDLIFAVEKRLRVWK